MKRITITVLFSVALAHTAFTAEVSTWSFSASDTGTFPKTIQAGKAIEIDLSAIPRDARIDRAMLMPGRDDRDAHGRRIDPVKVAVAGEDRPLTLRPPRYRSFDVTAPVAAAVKSGNATIAFDVVSFPGYRPPQTRLDVTLSAGSRNAVPRVSGLRVRHRSGQTFLTWNEPDPPIRKPDVTFGEWKELQRQRGAKSQPVRFRIYRSTRPFVSGGIGNAVLVDEVEPLTCWNPEFYGISPKDEQIVPRYVVENGAGPVAPGTGIYVHNPKQSGQAYYAVSVAMAGEENLSDFDESNSTVEPVAEQVGQGEPVLQRIERPESFQYVNGPTLEYYVRWEAPPNCNLPSSPYDYVVGIPPGAGSGPYPVGLHLHCWGGSLEGGYGWWYNAAQGALLLATNQIPYDWWTGYHEDLNTWKSWSEGSVHDYTQTRVLSFLDWLGTRYKVDRSRVFTAGNSMGGSGSPNFGIRYGDDIAWVVSWVGVHDPERSPQFRGSYENVYGKVEWELPFEDTGIPAFDYFNDEWYLREHPEREAPLICFSNGKNDGAIGWPQARDFWKALQDTRRPHVFVWGQAGHGQRARLPGPEPTERELHLDVRTDRTLPAFTRCSLDDNPGNGDSADGDPEGQSNLYLYWDTSDDAIVDQADRWAMTIRLGESAPEPTCTVDVTPRRCQQFRIAPGTTVAWTNTSIADGTEIGSGKATADEEGLISIPQMTVGKTGNRLELRAM